MRDLVALETDVDQRITARIQELRRAMADLGGLRDTIVADLSMQAIQQARREFLSACGDRLGQLERLGLRLEQATTAGQAPGIGTLAACVLATALLTASVTLGGVCLLLH